MQYYLKYRIPHHLIKQKLDLKKYNQINFFIDIQSIARGFFNKNVIQMEVTNYMESRNPPKLFTEELQIFMKTLYEYYSNYNIKFVIFYDVGNDNQNKSIDSSYKDDRGGVLDLILDDEQQQLFRQIRQYYFEDVNAKFNIDKICSIIYLKNVETDFVPFYAINNGYLNSQKDTTCNIILSIDKDLLQCCKFSNTYQPISLYKNKQIDMQIYDNYNAIVYLNEKIKPGLLGAEYIPLLLALSGDKADHVPNLYRGLGIQKAIQIIVRNNMPPIFNSSFKLPLELEVYKTQLLKNLSITSFELQIKRISLMDIDIINKKLESLS